jgi:hypothetical protein
MTPESWMTLSELDHDLDDLRRAVEVASRALGL